jgi:3-methylcrotonyl-CoA carboxylase alpha subunit
MRQEELHINGWAVEARLYAEDPASGFLPSTGTLTLCDFGHFLRVETGFREGDEVSPHYDPMLAKLIRHDEDRATALAELADNLKHVEIWPVKTNTGFLMRCLRHPEFVAGSIDTGFIARNSDMLVKRPPLPEAHFLEIAKRLMGPSRDGVWTCQSSFRLNATAHSILRVVDDEGTVTEIDVHDAGPEDWERFVASPTQYLGEYYPLSLYAPRGSGGTSLSDGAILSPMPGKIIAVDVAAGDAVVKGQRLLTLEAMKMEHSLTAPFDGVVAELNAEAGAQVQVEALLARIEAVTS